MRIYLFRDFLAAKFAFVAMFNDRIAGHPSIELGKKIQHQTDKEEVQTRINKASVSYDYHIVLSVKYPI